MQVIGGQDRRGAVVPALEATADAFLGGSGSIGGGAGGGGVLGPDSTTPYRLTGDRQIALRLARPVPLQGGWSVEPGLRLAAGQSRFHLPQGMGILTDPTQVGFQTLALTPEASLVYSRPLGPVVGSVRLGGGVQLAQVTTTLRSALLDVRHSGRVSSGVVWLGFGLADPARGLAAVVEGRVYQGRRAEFGAELRMDLPR